MPQGGEGIIVPLSVHGWKKAMGQAAHACACACSRQRACVGLNSVFETVWTSSDIRSGMRSLSFFCAVKNE
eukprot:3179470-Pleurochrysis_carterae.AAC.2